ncbi:hypothetical protein OEA23_12605 [Paenibacillus polysaccharolyticus]
MVVIQDIIRDIREALTAAVQEDTGAMADRADRVGPEVPADFMVTVFSSGRA